MNNTNRKSPLYFYIHRMQNIGGHYKWVMMLMKSGKLTFIVLW